MGFPILCEVVREERRDVELVRAALDCLTNAFTAPAHAASAQSQAGQLPLRQCINVVGVCDCTDGTQCCFDIDRIIDPNPHPVDRHRTVHRSRR